MLQEHYAELEGLAMDCMGLSENPKSLLLLAECVERHGWTKHLPAMTRRIGDPRQYDVDQSREALAMIALVKEAPGLTVAEIKRRIVAAISKAGRNHNWLTFRFAPELKREIKIADPDGPKRIPKRGTPGARPKYQEAFAIVKKRRPKTPWKQLYMECKKLSLAVPDDYANFIRTMQLKLNPPRNKKAQ